VNPAWATLAFTIFVRTREPTNLRRHAAAFSKRSLQVCTDAWRATNAVQERRLQDSWHAQGWRGEENAEGGSWSDEEVLSRSQLAVKRIVQGEYLHAGTHPPVCR
jgi:hypothetical protein